MDTWMCGGCGREEVGGPPPEKGCPTLARRTARRYLGVSTYIRLELAALLKRPDEQA
jgi:hypothetical protein